MSCIPHSASLHTDYPTAPCIPPVPYIPPPLLGLKAQPRLAGSAHGIEPIIAPTCSSEANGEISASFSPARGSPLRCGRPCAAPGQGPSLDKPRGRWGAGRPTQRPVLPARNGALREAPCRGAGPTRAEPEPGAARRGRAREGKVRGAVTLIFDLTAGRLTARSSSIPPGAPSSSGAACGVGGSPRSGSRVPLLPLLSRLQLSS